MKDREKEKNHRIGRWEGKEGLYLIADRIGLYYKEEIIYRDLDFLKVLVSRFESLRFFTSRYHDCKKAIEMIENGEEGELRPIILQDIEI